MEYIFAILGLLTLLAGFTAFTQFETNRGVRFFQGPRNRLDAALNRLAFITAHVDFSAWLREEMRRGIERTGHAIAHLALRAVRTIERILTRIVKHFRAKESVRDMPRESERPFIGTLASFKAQLSATRPAQADVLHKIS